MRNKLNEIRNKEEGFTLVELLAVIVILGIIMAIAVPSIGNIIKNSENKAKEAEIELVEDAARLYFIATDGDVDQKAKISIEDLATAGYLNIDTKSKLIRTVEIEYNKDTGKITMPAAESMHP